MMKVNIERRSVDVPASRLPAGTFFQYDDDDDDETRETSYGILLKVNMENKAVNLYSGEIVSAINFPYHVIRDVEFKGWV